MVEPTKMDEYVTEVGVSQNNPLADVKYCGKDVFIIWIGLQSAVSQVKNGVDFL